MAALATYEEFEARHAGLEESLVEALLDDASALIRTEVSTSAEEWVDAEYAGDDTPHAVSVVAIEVAFRAITSPGAGVESERLGAHAVAYRDVSEDALYLTKAERRIVRKAAGLGAFRTVTLVSPYSGDATDIEPELEL